SSSGSSGTGTGTGSTTGDADTGTTTGTTGGDEEFLGRWNLVRQTYEGNSYTYPRVYTYEYEQSCTYVYAVDLDLAPGGAGAFTSRGESSCYGSYDDVEDLEWELAGSVLNLYRFYDDGYYGETGSPTTGGTVPERVLFLSCAVSPTVLDCSWTDTEEVTITFARPVC